MSTFTQYKVDINMNEPNFQTDLKAKSIDEPLLQENNQRFVLFPIKYHDIWEMYKKQLASFWTADEIDLFQDLNDWEKLTDNERHFIKYVLAFFAARYLSFYILINKPIFYIFNYLATVLF